MEKPDPSQFVDAILRLLAEGKLATQLGQAGREKVLRSFQSNRSAQVLIESLSQKIDKET